MGATVSSLHRYSPAPEGHLDKWIEGLLAALRRAWYGYLPMKMNDPTNCDRWKENK